jgi:nucleotide-binding universal stress UspA family protein
MSLNILVLVDGSPDAQEALSRAIDLAESEHSRLTVLTAIAPPPPMAALGGVDARLTCQSRPCRLMNPFARR